MFTYFVQIAKMAALPYKPPPVMASLEAMEQFYGYDHTSLVKEGVSYEDIARSAISQLQMMGRLPVPAESDEFIYPQLDTTHESMMQDPMATKRPASGKDEKKSGQPQSSLSAHLSPISAATSTSVAPIVPKILTEEELAEIEKTRKERAATQAKVAAEKELEAQQRKAIKEQIEMDRAAKLREAEERKAMRELQNQENKTDAAAAASQQQSRSTMSQATSPKQSRTSDENVSNPNLARPTAQRVGEKESTSEDSLSPRPPIGTPLTSDRATPEPFVFDSVEEASTRVVRQGHWVKTTGTPPTSAPQATPEDPEMLQYMLALKALTVEREKVQQVLARFAPLRAHPEHSAQVEKMLMQYETHLNALNSDIDMLNALMRGKKPSEFLRRASAPPAEPAGFTLRDTSSTNDLEEETELIGRPLELTDSQTTWQIRIKLLDASQITVKLHPSHTVQDILLHVASISTLTSRHKLQLMGSKGSDLELEQTAESAKLKSTTLIITLK